MSPPRAELIHIDVDRRLGHEWDEWNGQPLPNRGNFDSPPALFFRWAVLAMVVLLGSAAAVIALLAPHLGAIATALPRSAWLILSVLAGLATAWFVLILLSYLSGRALLPTALAERG
ncbi:MAG TPA: hypothetical protein PLL69_10655, partial [Gemmatimonadales bacterium]|nr:hypothetical protein [Gemmatimonadales bacterium]